MNLCKKNIETQKTFQLERTDLVVKKEIKILLKASSIATCHRCKRLIVGDRCEKDK